MCLFYLPEYMSFKYFQVLLKTTHDLQNSKKQTHLDFSQHPEHSQIPATDPHPLDKAYGILLSFHIHHGIDLRFLKM